MKYSKQTYHAFAYLKWKWKINLESSVYLWPKYYSFLMRWMRYVFTNLFPAYFIRSTLWCHARCHYYIQAYITTDYPGIRMTFKWVSAPQNVDIEPFYRWRNIGEYDALQSATTALLIFRIQCFLTSMYAIINWMKVFPFKVLPL